MSRRQRKRLFGMAAGVVVGALLAITALDRSGDGKPVTRAPAAPNIAGTAPDRRATAGGERRAHGTIAALAEARRLARRFIAAFARYQAGQLDDTTARRLRRLATAQLAGYLLAQPPRGATPRQARVRIQRLDLAGHADGSVKAAALLAYRHRRRSLFELQLDRSGGRWRVSRLYPSGG